MHYGSYLVFLNICIYRTGERKAVREMALARGNVHLAAHLEASEQYYLNVFSCLFSEVFVKSDTIESNNQFQ